MKHLQVLIRPVITEKATAQEKAGKYLFYVRKDATKIDVRHAFERLYGVKVRSVSMLRTTRKTKIGRARKAVTKRPAFKKAIVTLVEKKEVNILKPKLKK